MNKMSREDAKKIVSDKYPDRIICTSQELNNGYVFFTKLSNMSKDQEQYWNEAFFVKNNKIKPFDLMDNMDLIIETKDTRIYY